MAKLVCIETFFEPTDALAAALCLRARGFIAILPEYQHASIAWHHVFALQGIRLWTLDSMADDARALLRLANPQEVPVVASSPRRRTKYWNATVFEFFLALAAYLLAGLPLPIWKRRQR